MKKRTHDIILNKLGSAIVKGEIKPLEKLSSDTDLCTEYNIGRNTLREIFKVLSAKGLLDASPRKGTWVREQTDWDIYDSDVLCWMVGTPLYNKILQDVSESRILIEPAAARMAAKNATMSDLAVIESAYLQMESANPQTIAACRADVNFHLGIFKASHNKVWVKFGEILSFTLVELFNIDAMQEKYIEELPMHKELLLAIRMKDEDKAEKKHEDSYSACGLHIQAVIQIEFHAWSIPDFALKSARPDA